MDIAKKISLKKILIFSVVGLVGLVATVFLMWFFDRSSVWAPEKTDDTENVQTPVEKKTIEVKLPNAEAIPALDEDYNDNSSLWRVVSKDYPLDDAANFVPTLAPATLPSAYGHQLRPDTTAAAGEMFAAAKTASYNLIVGSGYRSFATQQSIFGNYAAQNGEARANQFSARAGQSEHQTGLSFDVARSDQQCFIDNCFGDLPEAKWVAENSYKYGYHSLSSRQD